MPARPRRGPWGVLCAGGAAGPPTAQERMRNMDETTRRAGLAVVALVDEGAAGAAAAVLTLAQATAIAQDGRLVLADVLAVAEGQSASTLATPVRARREALLALLAPPPPSGA